MAASHQSDSLIRRQRPRIDVAADHVDAGKVDAVDLRMREIAAGQFGVGEIRTAQIRVRKVHAYKHAVREIRVPQIGPAEIRAAEFLSAEGVTGEILSAVVAADAVELPVALSAEG